ncbi:MAG: archaeosine biosynthesis radical SAM protein RaSEA [Candidatus Methanofastidiosia archaeon]
MVSWTNVELISGKVGIAKSVVLPTCGCYYDSCFMCSYRLSCPKETPEDIVEIFKQDTGGEFDKLKIFTSGSFFDKRELSQKKRKKILEITASLGVKEITVESRPEFITKDVLKESSEVLDSTLLEVAIGLESANNNVLKYCINKGFTFETFVKKASLVNETDCLLKIYLLLKPPFLTEYEAMLDVVSSAKRIADMTKTISINPVSVHKDTLVERLWRRGSYRPPFLWSLVYCLNELLALKTTVMSHPVAVGKARGIHNCGKCEDDIIKKIDNYNLEKTSIEATCDCKATWEKELTKIF